MTTLHIEHEVSDFDVWSTAFAKFEDFRQQAGVRAHSVRRPVDNPKYVVIDLEFDTVPGAEAFLETLRTKIWASPTNAPALVGTPLTAILQDAGPVEA